MSEEELPYRAEYAKSSRASCKSCKGKIEKESLRLAAMIQSPMFDGKVPNWYHYMCFFGKQRPPTVADIAHFDSLRYEDQEKIKAKIESAAGAAPTPVKGKGKGKGKAKGAAAAAGGGAKEFSIEVASSGRAGCKGCEQKILKGEVRIGKMDYTSESARRYGPMTRWHHQPCFLKLRDSLEYYGAATELPGFYALPADIQDQVKEEIKPIKRKAEDAVDAAPPVKKPKKEDEQLLKKQSDAIFKFRDQLKALPKRDQETLLEYNCEKYTGKGLGESKLLDYLSDFMVFGMTSPCTVCKGGLLTFRSGSGYVCSGYISEYTGCTSVLTTPPRIPFSIPSEMAKVYKFLGKYKQPSLGDRFFVDRGLTSAEKAAASTSQTLVEGPKRVVKPLEGLTFAVCGKDLSTDKKQVTEQVKELGGKVGSSVTANTAAVITTKGSVAECKEKAVKAAKQHGVQCVGEDFLDEVKTADVATALLLIKKKSISEWGEDPVKRVSGTKLYSSVHKSGKQVSKYVKSVPDKLTLKLKDGGAVDPDSGLSESAHVLTYDGKLYNSVLGLVDIVRGTNSYYKFQVLENDSKINTSYWMFRSWGRIGTTIGGNKLEEIVDKHGAMEQFRTLFLEKTGNNFLSASYAKLPGKWTVLDIDYSESKEIEKMVVSESNSSLPLAVQQLVALFFDVDTMKSQMMEFEIDLKKLPLGKLSRSQLTSAFSVLADAQRLLEGDSKDTATMLLDCSNRFYTLIPHDFGMNKVPMLDNLELIKTKIEMVESLREIEVAYSLLKDDSGSSEAESSVIDQHYAKLNTKIEPVDVDSDEFDILRKYVENTHAQTHSHYSLNIENAFRVERKGEAKRFKPFKKLPNHKLLWHGSRLTNFVGILSQGLRIAPPEAPATGYMFGKGIYFADMVSKSANYCATSCNNSTGIMLLCDVALGNMYERQGAEYVTKLASGKHSTKGCGRTFPDPALSTKLNGIEVPLGIPKADSSVKSSLLYNEYIVYDVAQVEVKYLLKMDFKYSTHW